MAAAAVANCVFGAWSPQCIVRASSSQPGNLVTTTPRRARVLVNDLLGVFTAPATISPRR